ncbi:MAG TPA: alkaline phosphatase family protein [Acidimicrobiales bacterium]|nr:alkaline phosphatase family protein [Acidimicrobiales bacterium]
MAAPEPVLPAFDGPCLTNLVPALRGHLNGDAALPDWVPPVVGQAERVVLLLLDGLGHRQLGPRSALVPTLASGEASMLTSVAPSTTAAALTSLTTGLPPAVHGIVGYRVAMDGKVLNVLGWRLDGEDARRRVVPARFQPFEVFPGMPVVDGGVPVVSRAEYATTGFTAAHLGRSILHGWYTPAEVSVEIARSLQDGTRFVYAYYDGIDRVAHARGLDEHYDAELRTADRLVADVLDVLPRGTALVVTADHGQVEVGPAVEVLGPDLMDAVTLISGEGRFRWLHCRPGAADDLAAAARARYGDVAWVLTLDEMLEAGWLGGRPVPAVAERLGAVALVPFEPVAFMDPADTGELRLVARHGSLTPDEMLVPLLAWVPTA